MDLENIAVKCKLGDDMRLKYKDSEYIFSEFSYKKDRVMTSRAAIKRLKASHDNEKQVRLPF